MDSQIGRQMSVDAREISLLGHWDFSEGSTNALKDLSGNGHHLKIKEGLTWLPSDGDRLAIALDGVDDYLETENGPLKTDRNFSIAAWVRLDRLDLEDNYAYTAVSQGGRTHSNFFLGVRRNDELLDDGTIGAVYRWCFTIAPLDGPFYKCCFDTTPDDGKQTAKHGWKKAYSSKPISESMLGQWILLVGTCDVEHGIAELLVPTIDDRGSTATPPGWPFWCAKQGLQIGRSVWLGDKVDHWPGAIAKVFAWEGIISTEQVWRIHESEQYPSV